MANPFQYGGVVQRDAFCNRKLELERLKQAMVNGERLFVYSERRLGKTSLVQQALARLPAADCLGAYVDLWPTDDAASFATATARALTAMIPGGMTRMLESARRFFARFTPTITTDAEGKPQIRFEVSRSGLAAPDLEAVLAAPEQIARNRKRRVVIVFDEFQRILEYENDLVERTLRSEIQGQKGVAFIFLGSRKHLIQKMVLDQSRPLYRAGGHYPLGPIEIGHWIPFIRNRFRKNDKRIGNEQIRAICRQTGGHPFYTQHLCHVIWERCPVGGEVTTQAIDDAIALLLDRETYAYTALWESFTLNQRRFLAALAGAGEEMAVYSADFLQTGNLSSASTVQRAAAALLSRDVIDRANGSFIISDRFFKIWINRSAAFLG
jgi:hypothetical protein